MSRQLKSWCCISLQYIIYMEEWSNIKTDILNWKHSTKHLFWDLYCKHYDTEQVVYVLMITYVAFYLSVRYNFWTQSVRFSMHVAKKKNCRKGFIYGRCWELVINPDIKNDSQVCTLLLRMTCGRLSGGERVRANRDQSLGRKIISCILMQLNVVFETKI